jgi:hypothetical protein
MMTVSAPGTYTVTLVNDGGVMHDLTFDDGTVINADGHTTVSGAVTIPAGGLNFHCSVPRHADAGMTGMVMLGSEAGGRPRHRPH